MKAVSMAAAAAVLVVSIAAPALAQDSADYIVTFTRLWTEKTAPYEYPAGAHFSGLIGATHNGAWALYKDGSTPTPGLEKLSEEGKHTPLDQEIKAAIAAGTAGALFRTGPIRDAAKMEETDVTVTRKYPLVSAVAMIAPSPDWFAGVAGVSLMEGGEWVESKSVDLFAYDSGGDDGATYKAADQDTNPKKATMAAATPHFVRSGNRVRVGTLTFTRKTM
jgi:hypothetical protein